MVPMPGMTTVTSMFTVIAVVHAVSLMLCVCTGRVGMVRRRGGVVVAMRLLGSVDAVVLMFVRICHRLAPLVRPAQEAGWISLSTTHLWFVMVMPSDS